MSLVRSSALLLALVVLGCASDPPPPAVPPPPAEIPDPGPPPNLDDVDLPTTEDWEDTSEGVEATLVYVTEQGRRGAASVAALVFSSDPKNPHFDRKSSAKVTVQRQTRDELGRLLADLSANGFDRLPWKPQAYDAEIGPQRALYLYRAGKRTWVEKDSLSEADQKTFTAIERRVIDASMRSTPR
jgi:hypothetical protein